MSREASAQGLAPTISATALESLAVAGANVIAAALAILAYRNFWRLGLPEHQMLAGHILGLTAVLLVGFGPLWVYPLARRAGTSMAIAVAACLVTPAAWVVKEVLRVTAFFSPAEALYYGLNSLNMMVVLSNLGVLGIAIVIRRMRQLRGGEKLRVVTPLPVALILLALVGLYVTLIWGLGVHWFYIYQQGYRVLFG